MAEMVKAYENGLDFVQHLDGVPWHDAPAPPKRHAHWIQTEGMVGLRFTSRCACGAFLERGRWILIDPPRVGPGPRMGRFRCALTGGHDWSCLWSRRCPGDHRCVKCGWAPKVAP